MTDLIGNRYGKLVVVGPSFHKGSYKFYAPCVCDCGSSLDVIIDNLISGNTSSCGCLKVRDKVGQKFGQLLVLSLDRVDDRGAWWLCRCDCGNEKVVRGSSLMCGDAKTCGHRADYTGSRFGKLLVLGKDDTPDIAKKKRIKWVCYCECGNFISVTTDNLKYGNTTSCRCNRGPAPFTAGLFNLPIYKEWEDIIQRCNGINHQEYKNYGGKGVTVCERWKSFSGFLEDMGVTSGGLSIVRVDSGKGYYKENCRWGNEKSDAISHKGERMVEFNGEKRCISEWAEVLGINAGTLIFRLNSGWSPEKAFTIPVKIQYRVKE